MSLVLISSELDATSPDHIVVVAVLQGNNNKIFYSVKKIKTSLIENTIIYSRYLVHM
jgi:hypothetical protein